MTRGIRERRSTIRGLVVATSLAMVVASAACAPRVYDPYNHDYHRWNHTEIVYYQQWEVETHRPHVEFAQRNADDQREYWTWRHAKDNQAHDDSQGKDKDHHDDSGHQ